MEELKKAYAQWESLYKQGGSDPFYPDGVNLNLVRNHILYFKRQIEETQPLYKNTEVYRRELPPQVEDSYMARAEEIRAHAKDALASYKADPYYQYLLHHREELDDAGLKKTSILPVLNYAQALETAIQEDDLVTMRRHERADRSPGFFPFLRCESTGCAGKPGAEPVRPGRSGRFPFPGRRTHPRDDNVGW